MKYQIKKKATLLLQDGTVFYGKAVGKEGTATGEICFNTGMTGYQEVFTDPSYYGQMMVTTNAHIGNYGTFAEEVESETVKIAGLIVKNFSYTPSRVLSDMSLEDFLAKDGIVAISDVDTRALVRHIRDKGAMNAIISSETDDIEELKAKLNQVPSMDGLELSSKVSTKEPYFFGDENADFRAAVLDVGVKKNILKCLADRGVYMKVFPSSTTYEEMAAWEPDGFFLSNGPGDPSAMPEVIEEVKKVLADGRPVFGICLGHQLICLANGVETFKMHNGHRGINHPVKNLKTGKGEITSQNHGFVVRKEDVENHPELEITHLHLNDGTVAGVRMLNNRCFSVQYHPEASPGPHDSRYLFDDFVELLVNAKNPA
ncbi:glutamine-hydrolyzing carbamoyl-phosphate synthase small subunit [Cryomorphaceae bacterium]|nr:glutamine-hydrolyzing carbamoyl-phosphate synthase small subunit [Cryomorphaceae bacterium]